MGGAFGAATLLSWREQLMLGLPQRTELAG
jgi:hypothetical protein